MNSAHLDRLAIFAQHGQPKDYGGSEMMRADLTALVSALAASGAPQEAPGDAPSVSQMLDWLAQRKHSFEFSTPGDHIAKKAWLVTLETGKSDRYGPICTEFDGDTLRDCISAAMKGPE